ncbi:hypothetical protein VPH35_041280 [Triticum aestivum]
MFIRVIWAATWRVSTPSSKSLTPLPWRLECQHRRIGHRAILLNQLTQRIIGGRELMLLLLKRLSCLNLCQPVHHLLLKGIGLLCQAMSPTALSSSLQQAGPVRLASSPSMRMRQSLLLRQWYLGLARQALSPIPSPRRKMAPPRQNLPSLAPRSIWQSQEAARKGVPSSSTICFLQGTLVVHGALNRPQMMFSCAQWISCIASGRKKDPCAN